MFAITIVTGLASLFGCLCMAAVCAAQLAELFAAARPAQTVQPFQPIQRTWEPGQGRTRLTPAILACPV